MSKRIYSTFFGNLWLVACCMSLLSSCNDSEKYVDDSLVTLKVVLPGDDLQEIQSDETRAGISEPGIEAESKINTLIFMIYNASNVVEIEKSVEIKSDWTSDDPMWDKNGKSLRIPVTQGSKQIYCIANWSLTGTTEMPLINKTTAPNPATLTGFIRNHANITPDNPPVMTASISTNITAGMQEMPVELKRQVARIELWPNISKELSVLGANVQITGIKFKSLATQAYLFPKSPVASPSGNGQWNQSDYFDIASSALGETASEFATKYYIPEYVPTGETTATEMIIRALYNDNVTYYRLKINPAVDASHTIPYAIERNHTYRYYLTILGKGSDSEVTRSISDQADISLAYKLEIR